MSNIKNITYEISTDEAKVIRKLIGPLSERQMMNFPFNLTKKEYAIVFELYCKLAVCEDDEDE